MTPQELFSDFIILSAYRNTDKVRQNLVDTDLGSGLIARLYEGSITVIGLTNGTRIQIPQNMVNVFTKFCEKYASSVLAINKIKKGDKISKFIILMVRFLTSLNNKLPGIETTLGEICENGSKEFRDWCKSEFELEIRPISFSSIDNNLYL